MKAVFTSFLSILILLQSSFAGDWSQWRGDNRDGVTHGEKALVNLPGKPKALWQVSVGKGQGGLIIAAGKIVMLHETMVKGKPMETAVVIDARTGKTLWETPYAESWQYGNVYQKFL